MNYIDTIVENTILQDCPYDHLSGSATDMDDETYTTPLFGTGEHGCRGITCKECWNQEVEG